MSEINETAIRTALREFAWDNYGLDNVAEADPEWATHLAAKVQLALVAVERPTELSAEARRAAGIPSQVFQAVAYDDSGYTMTDEEMGGP